MEFKIVYGNHNNEAVQLYDTLMLIKYGLESAGHKADFEQFMTPGATNILIECFTWDFVDVFRDIAKVPGTEFIVIATEFLTGDCFNNFSNTVTAPPPPGAKLCQYENQGLWRKRYRTFRAVAEHARSVWHLSDLQVSTYRQRLGRENVHCFPHGYLQSMERLTQKPTPHQDIDVIFTGTMTPYRRTHLQALQAAGLEVQELPVQTQAWLRDDRVARARLALNIRQNAEWQYPSNSRFYYHLINRSMLISETCPEKCSLTPYVLETEIEDLLSSCYELLENDRYRHEADDRYTRFRDTMPMAPLMAELLDSTYALNSR